MFCEKCGTQINEERICPTCDAEAKAPSAAASPSPENALQENVAGLLCYLLGWVTGIIFFIIDKRPSVRFHALQSIVTFGGLSLLTFILNQIISIFPYTIWRLLSVINTLISLASLALAIFLMFQAYKGKQYRLPFVSSIAEKLSVKIESKV